MADIFGSGNKADKWTQKATEWINYLYDNKSDTLVAGQNVTLTPDTTNHTVTISASGGGGGGTLTDVQVNGTSVVSGTVANVVVSDVALTGSYMDLSNLPTIPTLLSQLTDDSTHRLVTDTQISNWNAKIDSTARGAANGVASLGSDGKVPSSELPSYVDDVLEYSSLSAFPATGESGKIYIALDTNKTYRWSGSAYVEISESLALGTTHSTAYYGDYGQTAYSHATDASRLTTATASGLYKVASTAEGHIASLTVVQKSDITALGIPAQDTTYSDATQSAHGLMSTTDKTKLDGIAAGAEVNVQSDWSQSDSNADDFIKNKPTIPTVNDGTLTITQNGTSKGTFTANQSGNATIALTDTTGYINQNETVLATDKVPYVMRQAKSIANATPYIRETLVGGSFGWNQILQNGNFASTSGWSTYAGSLSASDNILTEAKASGTASNSIGIYRSDVTTYVAGHKYLVLCDIKSSAALSNYIYLAVSNQSVPVKGGTLMTSWNTFYNIFNLANVTNNYINLFITNMSSYTSALTLYFRNFMLVDLTIMLGTTIADYIYSIETATAGSGIAKLREWGFFTKTYYPYNAGNVLSVQTRGHKITDANNENTVTYNVDDVILRGVPKLDANNNLYYDGDTYSSDGHVIVKYSFVDLGSLSWIAGTAGGFQANISGLKEGLCGLRTAKYRYDETTSFSWANFSTLADKTIYRNSGSGNYTIYVKDTAYSDAASFTTAVSGNVLVYERSTSSDTTWHPFENPQYIYPGGTEEYIDTREIPVPVGHITEYMGASEDKFYMPSSPLDDEKYMMTYHNGSILWTKGNAWISLLDGYYDAYAQGQNIALPPNWTRLKISLECHSLDLGDSSKMIENEISRPTYEDGHYMSSGTCSMTFGMYGDLTCSITLSESTFEGITTYYIKMNSVTLGQTTTTDYHFWIYYQS